MRPKSLMLLALLPLTACGGIDPGTAASSGEQSVSLERVDEITGLYCDALATVGTLTSRVAVRSYVANSLVSWDLAHQFAADHGVDLTAAMAPTKDAIQAQLPTLTQDQADAVIEVSLVGNVAAVLDPLMADSAGTVEDFLASQQISYNPAIDTERVAVPTSPLALASDPQAEITTEQAQTLPAAEQCGAASAL